MSASLTWKASKAGNQGQSRVRIVLRAKMGTASEPVGERLAPEGFAALRERVAAARVKPGAVTSRAGYTVSELSSVQAMMQKLRRGEDLRQEKISAARRALEHEDFESALKVEIAVERILDELQD